MPIRYKTCLLVDDNYIDNFVTRKILESGNFAEEIIVQQSPQDALESLRDGSVKPDVIFLDIRMPTMSGFEFLEAYDAMNLDNSDKVKIFMLSSSLDPTDIANSGKSRHVARFIHKPLTYEVLEELNT
ncbi:response regulator [Mucilaginibacter terrenus]|uniref:Response regulator n=1 Tax=Mucilaginibacter terrenus TaxID=2482727 RepID=A0A3E2NLD1_9SPHI|nr:response regulator [Mucilaginibacter terrenus]RFZ81814.1 response regulator [Mucilaginibacter terrenus]